MLVLTRKPGESFTIGGNVTVTILKQRGKGMQIGIEAPDNVKILRSELSQVEEIEQQIKAGVQIHKIRERMDFAEQLEKRTGT